ncbi:mucin-2-like [Hemiscyllium ocellatum]|uniref:mucin-2-like n=1 Tax=Hemiscyllium ocellatum TaxID=170820 RepID=UPI002965E46F|nr:mucin-2-like [Hemiscyllium ocellatum]
MQSPTPTTRMTDMAEEHPALTPTQPITQAAQNPTTSSLTTNSGQSLPRTTGSLSPRPSVTQAAQNPTTSSLTTNSGQSLPRTTGSLSPRPSVTQGTQSPTPTTRMTDMAEEHPALTPTQPITQAAQNPTTSSLTTNSGQSIPRTTGSLSPRPSVTQAAQNPTTSSLTTNSGQSIPRTTGSLSPRPSVTQAAQTPTTSSLTTNSGQSLPRTTGSLSPRPSVTQGTQSPTPTTRMTDMAEEHPELTPTQPITQGMQSPTPTTRMTDMAEEHPALTPTQPITQAAQNPTTSSLTTNSGQSLPRTTGSLSPRPSVTQAAQNPTTSSLTTNSGQSLPRTTGSLSPRPSVTQGTQSPTPTTRMTDMAEEHPALTPTQPITQDKPRNVSISLTEGHQGRLQEGDSVTLRCDVLYTQPAVTGYSWYQDGTRLPSAWSQTMEIRNITFSQFGEYFCEARNTIGSGRSEGIELRGQYGPRNVEIISEDTVMEGTEITLTCRGEANPPVHTYSWGKMCSGQRKDLRENTDTIRIQPTRNDASCSYICTAGNSVSSRDSAPKHINVQYGPGDVTIVRNEPQGEVKEGDRVTLTCNSRSNPGARYTWYKDSVNTAANKGTGNILTIRSITPTDSGDYYCKAENIIGRQTSKSFRIEVLLDDSGTEAQRGIPIQILVVIVLSVLLFVIIVCLVFKRKGRCLHGSRSRCWV